MSKPAKILVVDDSGPNRFILNEMVNHLGHYSVIAENGAIALNLVRKEPVDMILLDILMPEMDGYEFLDRIKDDSVLRHIPVVMISAVEDMDSIVRCIQKGADDYLIKPFNPSLLKARISACLEKKRLRDSERELLEDTLNGSIKVLTDILALVNPTAFSRTARLKRYVRHIAEQCNLSDIWQFESAAMLSQIGCIALPPDLLDKVYAGQDLTREERDMFASHPDTGQQLLSKIPRLEIVSNMIAKQRDLFDLRHKTENLGQREIENLGGQILRIAIDYDSFTLHGMSHKDALEKLRSQPDKYDSEIVSTLDHLPDSDVQMELKNTTLDKLRVGMIIDEDFFAGDVLVVAKGIELTLPVLERLRRLVQRPGNEGAIRVLVPKEAVV